MARKLHARGRWRKAMHAHLARHWNDHLFFVVLLVSWLAGCSFWQQLGVLVILFVTEEIIERLAVRPLRAAMERRYAEGVRQGRIAMYGEVARHLVTHDPQALHRLEVSQREGVIEV